MSKSMFNLMALLQNLHPLQATNLKGEKWINQKEFVWKPSIQKPSHEPLLKNNSTFHNSQKHSLLKTMNFQNFPHTHTHFCSHSHMLKMFETKILWMRVSTSCETQTWSQTSFTIMFSMLVTPITTFKSTLCWN